MQPPVRSGLFARDWRCRVRRSTARAGRRFALRLTTRFKSDIEGVKDVLDLPAGWRRWRRVEVSCGGGRARMDHAAGIRQRAMRAGGGCSRRYTGSIAIEQVPRAVNAGRCATVRSRTMCRGWLNSGHYRPTGVQRDAARPDSTLSASHSEDGLSRRHRRGGRPHGHLSRGEVRRGWFFSGSGLPRERQATSAPPGQRGRTS